MKNRNSRSCFVVKNTICSKSKRSQAHVEIVLSFVIFVGFLLVIFLFLNPFAKTQEISFIGGIERAIIKNVSAEVGKLSVIVGEIGDCYFVGNNYGENYQGVLIGDRKYIVYFSDEVFSGGNLGCSDVGDYTLGVFSKEDMIVYDKLVELKTNYEADYDSLKQSFGVMNGFSFSVKEMVGDDLIVPDNIMDSPSGIEVEAKNILMRVIKNNGRISEWVMNLRVW